MKGSYELNPGLHTILAHTGPLCCTPASRVTVLSSWCVLENIPYVCLSHIAGRKGGYKQDIYSHVRPDTCLDPKSDLSVFEEKEPEKLGMRQEEWSSQDVF